MSSLTFSEKEFSYTFSFVLHIIIVGLLFFIKTIAPTYPADQYVEVALDNIITEGEGGGHGGRYGGFRGESSVKNNIPVSPKAGTEKIKENNTPGMTKNNQSSSPAVKYPNPDGEKVIAEQGSGKSKGEQGNAAPFEGKSQGGMVDGNGPGTGLSGTGSGDGGVGTGGDGGFGSGNGYNIFGLNKRKIISHPLPKYPAGVNVEADVKLEFEILADGRVGYVRVVKKANPQLEKAAINSLKLWRFQDNGIAQKVTIVFPFRLK